MQSFTCSGWRGKGERRKKKDKGWRLTWPENQLATFLVLQVKPTSGWWWQRRLRFSWGNGQSGGREGGERKKTRQRWFFLNFSFWFPLPQAMKLTFIYRGWKRETLSHIVSNLGLWFDLKGSQPLPQSSYHGLPILLQEKTGRVGHFEAMPPPLWCWLVRKDHTWV